MKFACDCESPSSCFSCAIDDLPRFQGEGARPGYPLPVRCPTRGFAQALLGAVLAQIASGEARNGIRMKNKRYGKPARSRLIEGPGGRVLATEGRSAQRRKS